MHPCSFLRLIIWALSGPSNGVLKNSPEVYSTHYGITKCQICMSETMTSEYQDLSLTKQTTNLPW
jgi:hypothetical protein